MKKISILLFLASLSSTSHALTKCVIDGKTVYKNGVCPQGTKSAISGGTFSGIETTEIRERIEEQKIEKYLKNSGIKTIKDSDSSFQDKLKLETDKINLKNQTEGNR